MSLTQTVCNSFYSVYSVLWYFSMSEFIRFDELNCCGHILFFENRYTIFSVQVTMNTFNFCDALYYLIEIVHLKCTFGLWIILWNEMSPWQRVQPCSPMYLMIGVIKHLPTSQVVTLPHEKKFSHFMANYLKERDR